MADERFSGDMSRNEVEMDLSKFMEMIQENAALKDEIRDLKANDTVNPWQKWVHLARTVDWCIMQLCGLWNYQNHQWNNLD